MVEPTYGSGTQHDSEDGFTHEPPVAELLTLDWDGRLEQVVYGLGCIPVTTASVLRCFDCKHSTHQAPNVFRSKFLKNRLLKSLETPVAVIIDGERRRPSRMIAPTHALEQPCLQVQIAKLSAFSFNKIEARRQITLTQRWD